MAKKKKVIKKRKQIKKKVKISKSFKKKGLSADAKQLRNQLIKKLKNVKTDEELNRELNAISLGIMTATLVKAMQGVQK